MKIIEFEGCEGSGKSTQVKLLKEKLEKDGYSVYTYHEPGGTEISDSIKQILLNNNNKNISPKTELLLFLASRMQLIQEELKPKKDKKNTIIIFDRYIHSTMAYQGYGREVCDLDTFSNLIRFGMDGYYPDMTFFLYMDVEEGFKRKRENGCEYNRMDNEAREFYKNVMDGYIELSKYIGNWFNINGEESKEDVSDTIYSIVKRIIPHLDKYKI